MIVKKKSRIISEKNRTETNNANGNEILQEDLDRIKEWATKWKMEFNIDKCKIMHLGKTNPKHSYSMGDGNLTVTSEEKDLGVTIDDRLEFDVHIKNIINRANRLLGLIKIGFSCLDKEIFLNLYTVLVRPLLEYCVQVWSPYKQMYINQLEKVQDRATRLVPGLKDKTYEKRLEILGITTLVERRFRGDILQAYKMVTYK